MFKIWVDDLMFIFDYGYTIMQSAALLGLDLPRFCYHDKLFIAGNCRICLVEIVGVRKLVISCAKHIKSGMRVLINSARVKFSRKSVLEFLLANHPLDCPICDQGGECDLQDLSLLYASDRGRYYESSKRSVFNKDFGPLIQTDMNRCIHCTRCVRFLKFSTGQTKLITFGRGLLTEITNYVDGFIDDPLSGNIIDLCPVGALTSKPFLFKLRTWELTFFESLDIFDSLVSSVWVEVFGNKIYRVLPYLHEELNEDWISNRARFGYDGLFVQRIFSSFFRVSLFDFFHNLFGVFFNSLTFFIRISTKLAIRCFFSRLFFFSSSINCFFLIGSLIDLVTLTTLRYFLTGVGLQYNYFLGLFPKKFFFDFDFLFLFNSSMEFLTLLPSFICFIAVNTRFEAPLLNLKLNKLFLKFNFNFFSFGLSEIDISFPVFNLSNNVTSIFKVFVFKHQLVKNFYELLFNNFFPFFLINGKLFKTFFGEFFLFDFFFFFDTLKLISNLSNNTMISSLEITCSDNFFYYSNFGILNLTPATIGNSEILGAFDENLFEYLFFLINTNFPKYSFLFYSLGFFNEGLDNLISAFSAKIILIYQGSHWTDLLNNADLILPTALYLEQSLIVRNLFGLVYQSSKIIKDETFLFSDSEIWGQIYVFTVKKFFCFLENFYVSVVDLFSYGLNTILKSINVNNFWIIFFGWLKDLNLFKLCYFFRNFNKIFFLNFDFIPTFDLIFMNSRVGWRTSVIGGIFNLNIRNYYGSNDNLVLKSSRVLALCAWNSYSSLNFSFPKLLF